MSITSTRPAAALGSLLMATVLAVTAFGLAAASPAEAARSRRLGGISIAAACNDDRAVSHGIVGGKAVVVDWNAYGWRCRVPTGGTGWMLAGKIDQRINLNRACRTQYGNNRAYARHGNWHTPFSWSCYI